jgi:hypothetical protein
LIIISETSIFFGKYKKEIINFAISEAFINLVVTSFQDIFAIIVSLPSGPILDSVSIHPG